MRYARAKVNKKEKLPPEIVEALAAGENLFDMYEKCEGDWSKVVIQRKLTRTKTMANLRGSAMMTKQDLFQKYGNWGVVNRIIERKTKMNQFVDNVDLPGDEDARLYDCFDFAKKQTTDEAKDETEVSVEANAMAGEAVANLARSLAAGFDDVPADKPKPKAKPKKEMTKAEKVFGEVRRMASKLTSLMEECMTWQGKAVEHQWAYGEQKLQVHHANMGVVLKELHQVKAGGKTDDNIEHMQTALDKVKPLLDAYATDLTQVKRLAGPAKPTKKKEKDEKKKDKKNGSAK